MFSIKMTETPMFTLNVGLSEPSTSTVKSTEVPGTSQVSLDNVQDFSNVCRTCATITEFVIPIFTGEGLQNNLADKIHKHLPIKVAETDELPRVVCYQCASTLLAWHELVTCCHHADAVLRARLAADTTDNDKEPKAANSKSNLSIDDDAQSKSKTTKNYLVQSMEQLFKANSPPNQSSIATIQSMSLPIRPLALPFKSIAPPVQVVAPLVQNLATPSHVMTPPVRFIAPSLQPLTVPIQAITPLIQSSTPISPRQPPQYTPPHHRCDYCNTLYPEDKYSEHMVTNHSELVFFCEECNRFVSKTVLLIHMSLHAYGYIPKKEMASKSKEICDVNVNENNEQNASLEEIKPENFSASPNCQESKNNEDNEFSDHSDTENDFNPIPESVFEAIEDTQDSQAEDVDHAPEYDADHTPELEHFSDESSTSIPAEGVNAKKCRLMSRTCPICSRKFTASSSFFYHMKFTHKKTKEHQCDICSKQFATRWSLTVHNATHSEERRFECKECNKRFRSKASLYIHEQIHNGIKNYSCTECDMSFRWKTHLGRHMKRHAAEKAHLCSTCGRGFSVRCDLLRHVRTHTAGSFTCEKCSLVFAQMRYLKAHMTKKHSTDSEEIVSTNS